MSNIYLKVTIEKNWCSQNFDFRGLKNLSPCQKNVVLFLEIGGGGDIYFCMRIYIFCFKKTFTQIKKFPLANLFVRIYDFFLQTIKSRTLCFSAKESAVRVVL